MMYNSGLIMSDQLMYGFTGGPMFKTDAVSSYGGGRTTLQRWEEGLKKFQGTLIPQNQTLTDALVTFFRIHKGSAKAFLLYDPIDHSFSISEGIIGTGLGTGYPTYQLYKKRVSGSESDLQKLTRPKTGTIYPLRNSIAITFGSGAGNVSLDYTTGIFTFVADASSSAISITPGTTTSVVLTTNPGTLTSGKLLYLSGFTGTDASLVNGIAHTINSVSGSGPYTFVLATNTNGKTITLGSGNGYKFPQVSDVLTCSGEFYTPAYFQNDEMNLTMVDSRGFYQWNSIEMMEDRE